VSKILLKYSLKNPLFKVQFSDTTSPTQECHNLKFRRSSFNPIRNSKYTFGKIRRLLLHYYYYCYCCYYYILLLLLLRNEKN